MRLALVSAGEWTSISLLVKLDIFVGTQHRIVPGLSISRLERLINACAFAMQESARVVETPTHRYSQCTRRDVVGGCNISSGNTAPVSKQPQEKIIVSKTRYPDRHNYIPEYDVQISEPRGYAAECCDLHQFHSATRDFPESAGKVFILKLVEHWKCKIELCPDNTRRAIRARHGQSVWVVVELMLYVQYVDG